MVSILTKNIKGHEYLYLVDSIRDGSRVIQKTIKYIGKKRPVSKQEFECMKYSYKNEDWILKEFTDSLSYQDHTKMMKASSNYKKHINSLDSVSKEKEREKFLSLFISHSNAIEGSTLTPEETHNLLFKDITPKGHTKKEFHMASNMMRAWEYLEKNYPTFPSSQDLFKLHEFVNREIEDDSTLGKYKKVQNYIGNINTTSFLFVEEKMVQLLSWIKKAYKTMDDFEVVFQSHAQFEIIHPFIDGNGRVGRLLINWLLMYKHLSPLSIRVSKRGDYISSLNTSRKGKIEAIVKFCYKEYLEQYNFIYS